MITRILGKSQMKLDEDARITGSALRGKLLLDCTSWKLVKVLCNKNRNRWLNGTIAIKFDGDDALCLSGCGSIQKLCEDLAPSSTMLFYSDIKNTLSIKSVCTEFEKKELLMRMVK